MQGKKQDFQSIFSEWFQANKDEKGVAHITTKSWKASETVHYIYRTLHYFKVLARSKSLPKETEEFLKPYQVNICGKSMADFIHPNRSRRERKSPLETLKQASFKSRVMLYPDHGTPRRPSPTERAYLAFIEHIQNQQYVIWNIPGDEFQAPEVCAQLYGIHNLPEVAITYENDSKPILMLESNVCINVLKIERHFAYSKAAYQITYIAHSLPNRFACGNIEKSEVERTAILTFSSEKPKNIRILTLAETQ